MHINSLQKHFIWHVFQNMFWNTIKEEILMSCCSVNTRRHLQNGWIRVETNCQRYISLKNVCSRIYFCLWRSCIMFGTKSSISIPVWKSDNSSAKPFMVSNTQLYSFEILLWLFDSSISIAFGTKRMISLCMQGIKLIGILPWSFAWSKPLKHCASVYALKLF